MEEIEIKFESVTIKQLKDWLKDHPETDDNGDPYEVWIEYDDGLSTVATSIWKLNRHDVLLSTR